MFFEETVRAHCEATDRRTAFSNSGKRWGSEEFSSCRPFLQALAGALSCNVGLLSHADTQISEATTDNIAEAGVLGFANEPGWSIFLPSKELWEPSSILTVSTGENFEKPWSKWPLYGQNENLFAWVGDDLLPSFVRLPSVHSHLQNTASICMDALQRHGWRRINYGPDIVWEIAINTRIS